MKLRTIVAAIGVALALPSAAFAHARVSPPVGLKGQLELYSLDVPTEQENATTTTIEFTPPPGFSIDSFVPSPGWTRKVHQTGSGDNAVITKVTWSGGHVPTGEDAAFSFLAVASSAKTYTFGVRQTYSNGKVVDWSGPESSDTPSATVDVRSSFGGGSSSTLAIVAIAIGGAGVLLAALALLSGGRRTLA
jgi:uncharacterized protein YcnI